MSDDQEDQYVRIGNRIVNTRTGQADVDTSKNLLFASNDHKLDGRRVPDPKFVTGTRRYLDDLRMPAKDSRPHAIVLAYTLFGLSDSDIAFILNTPVERIGEVRGSKEYNHILDCILQNVREHDKDKVRKVLNDNAQKAAEAIVAISQNDKHRKQLEAASKVLDMTGHNRNSEIENKTSIGITVRYIDDREKPATIEIDDGV